MQKNKHKLINKKGAEVNISELLLHDNDSKAVIRGQNGHLYYQDLEKSMLIEEFVLIIIFRLPILRELLQSTPNINWHKQLLSKLLKLSAKVPYIRLTQEQKKELEA